MASLVSVFLEHLLTSSDMVSGPAAALGVEFRISFFSFQRPEKGNPGKFNDLPKVTEHVGGWADTPAQVWCFSEPRTLSILPRSRAKSRGESPEVQGPPRSSTAPSAGLSAGEPVRQGGRSQPRAEAVLRVPPPRSGPLRSPREASAAPPRNGTAPGARRLRRAVTPITFPALLERRRLSQTWWPTRHAPRGPASDREAELPR